MSRCPNVIGPVPKLDFEVLHCALEAGHRGDHEDALGAWWVDGHEEPTPLAPVL